MKNLSFFLLFIAVLLSASSFGQKEKVSAYQGNKDYNSGNFEAATKNYEKSLEVKPNYFEGIFNLGNSLHREAINIGGGAKDAADEETQKQLLEQSKALNGKAAAQFEMAAENSEDKLVKAQAYHNMGNAKVMSGDLDGGIEAYKKALRNNPTDEDTRYNLAFAQQMKKKQEQEQQQNQDQNQEQDKEKDKENQDDKQQEQDKENQDEKKDGDQQDQQPQPNQLSKEDAQEMLNALEKEEKDVQDKVRLKKMNPVKSNIEKDW